MSLFRQLSSWTKILGKVLQPFFLLIIRVLWGYGFLKAGLGKLMGIEKTAEFFSGLDIPYPYFNAYFVGLVEAIGGLFLIVGFGSRLISIPLVVTMFVALATAHKDSFLGIYEAFDLFSSQSPIPYLLTALTVLCFGPGLFSIDAMLRSLLEKKEEKK